MKFADILDSLVLIQHVTCPTHISGHTLDLIITRNEDNIIVSPPVCDTFLSDHSTLLCDVAFEKAPPVRNTIQLRRLKHIDIVIFRKDLSIQLNKMRDTTDLEPLVDTLNTSLRSTLDLHAPVVTIQVTERPHHQRPHLLLKLLQTTLLPHHVHQRAIWTIFSTVSSSSILHLIKKSPTK